VATPGSLLGALFEVPNLFFRCCSCFVRGPARPPPRGRETRHRHEDPFFGARTLSPVMCAARAVGREPRFTTPCRGQLHQEPSPTSRTRRSRRRQDLLRGSRMVPIPPSRADPPASRGLRGFRPWAATDLASARARSRRAVPSGLPVDRSVKPDVGQPPARQKSSDGPPGPGPSGPEGARPVVYPDR
jgi:hypothetical protein